MVENRRKALSMGADDFHEKPLERDWLLNRLKIHANEAPPEQVLIVDDDEVARYVLKGLLADTRFSILEASSGREGLELSRKLRPAAIFLDLVMPDMNGFEVLEQLKADPAKGKIPVIAVTSKLLTDEEREWLAGKTVAVLSKDHSSRDISLVKIREVLLEAGLRRWHNEGEPA